MTSFESKPINNNEVASTQETKSGGRSISLEALIYLVNAERLMYLQQKSEKEFSELKDRQDAVAKLHKLLQKIHAAISDSGELKPDAELKELLKAAKDLGVDVPDKDTFTKTSREALENDIQRATEDLNVQNEMQLQKVNRIMDERQQSYQQALRMMKVLHDAAMYSIKAFGR